MMQSEAPDRFDPAIVHPEAARGSAGFLRELGNALRPLAGPIEIQEVASRMLGEYLQADRVGYAQAQGDDESVVVTRSYTDGVPAIEGRYCCMDCGPAILAALRAGQTVLLPDIANAPALTCGEKAACAALQLGAAANVPLLKEGHLIAVMFVHYRQAHQFAPVEIALLEDVAQRTWDAMTRERAALALRESEQKYRTLLEAMDEAFAVCELIRDTAGQAVDFRWIFCNPAFERRTGLKRDAVLGHTAAELMPTDYLWWVRAYSSVVETARSHCFEHGIDSLGRAWEVTAFPYGADRFAVLYGDRSERNLAARESALLGAIVNSCDDAIVSKDLNGIIQSWNRGAERIFGHTAEEAIGQSITLIIPADRLHEESAILEQLKRGERVDHLETVRARKDGSLLHVSLTISPVKDAEGRIVGASKVARDITERKRISELQERLAAIVESSDDAMISEDLDGIILSWNRGAERLFGYQAEEIVGKHISTIAAPDRIDEIPGILDRIRRGERVEHVETRRMAKDGRILTVSITVSPIRNASGVIIGASKVARDITDRVLHQKALEQANTALRHANADLQQFAYSASHDLQEPLRMVAAYSELLQREFGGQLGEAGNEYIRHTIRGAQRMESLLRDLRTYMQVSTADQQPADDVEAGEILRKTLGGLQQSIEESGAAVTSTPLPCVRMHGFELEQVFQNLIGNAIRYRTSAPPRIHITAGPRESDWLFSVQDNGIGIDPRFKEQIFGIFKRLHSNSKYPGTGMGLAICHRIVERAGGRIWVESEPGAGSTFFFTIPRGTPP
jgi:PAS domain S-box-containing protein